MQGRGAGGSPSLMGEGLPTEPLMGEGLLTDPFAKLEYRR